MTVLFFPFLMRSNLFVWLLWLGLPVLCWIRVVVCGHPCLVLILKRNTCSFCPSSVLWLCVCHIWLLLRWGMFPILTLLRVFIINGCWFPCSFKCFSSKFWILSNKKLYFLITYWFFILSLLKNWCEKILNFKNV